MIGVSRITRTDIGADTCDRLRRAINRTRRCKSRRQQSRAIDQCGDEAAAGRYR